MHQDPNAPPLNPLPPVVWILFVMIMGVEGAFTLGANGLLGGNEAIGWRLAAMRDYGFHGPSFDWMLASGQMRGEFMLRFLTYPFVHGSFTGAIFAGVILLALGKMVGEVMGQLAVVIVFVFSGIFGAIIFGLLTNQVWLIGAMPCVYGLIGAYSFLLWQRALIQGTQQWQAFQLIGFLMGIQLVFGIFFATGLDWVADLAGFICGFVLSVVVVPGGLGRLRAMVQRR
ncbi:MAG: membrane associated rhomboid family serine protease [Ascidiaceihabitans sp.]|jgi:membrane associated rhomboid family serine protease